MKLSRSDGEQLPEGVLGRGDGEMAHGPTATSTKTFSWSSSIAGLFGTAGETGVATERDRRQVEDVEHELRDRHAELRNDRELDQQLEVALEARLQPIGRDVNDLEPVEPRDELVAVHLDVADDEDVDAEALEPHGREAASAASRFVARSLSA